MSQDPYRYFRPEAREILDQFSRGMLDLEKGESGSAIVQQLLRLAHTLKGAARVVKQSDIASRAHSIEELLSPLRSSQDRIGRGQVDAVLAHLDAINGQLASLAPAATPSASQAANGVTEEASRTVRTEIAEADAVLDGVVETHSLLNGFRTAARDLQEAARLADFLVAELPGSCAADNGGENSRTRQWSAVAEDLRRKLGAIDRNSESTVDQMDRELRQLREAAERLRLVPAESLFTTLERMARDTARAQGKRVTFKAGGGGIRLDAHVLDAIQGALVQIVRNAVAHGIESVEARTKAGKSAVGNVAVEVFRRDRRIVFSCRDDGDGINLDAVRQVASQRGLIGSATTETEPDELMRMLLRGGISTSATVTEESGRGIGLDVVRVSVERLGGEVACRSDPGRGTTFEMMIPPSLSSMDALLVENSADGGTVAIPLDAVRSTLRVSCAEIASTASGASILHGGTVIPFVPLAAVLDQTAQSLASNWAAAIVAGGDGLAAVGAGRLLGTAKIVVRPLPQHMTTSPAVLAAALDVDGNPQLVLNPDGLVAAAHRCGAGEPPAPQEKRRLLVVDDSLTTRMLEQSILESAGYDVDLAVSGEEALERVRGQNYALILVDVEMPGIDGFTFIERLRSDSRTREIPAILVTSLAKREHRQRGREVGAQGYIVKSEFDQAELLSMIKPMMAA
jgi:two-component system, chemotaxis family, sensor kinase CheA